MKAADKKVVFEIARRSPGVRLIIINKGKEILLAKEFRNELNAFDYRLPGGKVFDTLKEYQEKRQQEILPFAIKAAEKECQEETGLLAKDVVYFATTKAGATVEWDLFYFIIDDFEELIDGQNLETGEIIDIEWKSFTEVRKLCKDGKIKEDRTLGILFRFFLKYPQVYIKRKA